MKFKLSILTICFLLIFGCAGTIKPMEIPIYKAPDLSMLKKPEIPPLVEGKDYTKDTVNNTYNYTVTGQDKLTAKIFSEDAAYQMLNILKQVVDVQTQLIQQKDQLIIQIDLQRQYADKANTRNEVKTVVSEIIAAIGVGLAIAAVAWG